MSRVIIEESWKEQLENEFNQPYMGELRNFLIAEKRLGKTVYPKGNQYFHSMNLTPFKKVKVVILGQDPYHQPNQAHGLSFSVPRGVKLPPSLVNIYKELENDLSIAPAPHGCLESWSMQGVLLLNSVLTVEDSKPASHQNQGWERFTDNIIAKLNMHRKNIVFILWGSYAHNKGEHIDADKHLVLKSAHPSPLSAYRGFFGSKPFSTTNKYLQNHNIDPIKWDLSGN